jgi:hypothetical protein
MNILVQQSTAALGKAALGKEVWAAARSKMSITPFGVAEQSFVDRPMQGTRRDLLNLLCETVSTPSSRSTVVALKPDRLG